MTPTAPLRRVDLIFPCQDRRMHPFELLMPLKPREVQGLLSRMALLEELGESQQGLEELVYRDSVIIQYPRRRKAGIRPCWVEETRPFGCAAHNSVRERFQTPVAGGQSLALHVRREMVFLSGRYWRTPFQSAEAIRSEILRCRLATAQRRSIPEVFRDFSCDYPRDAVNILEHGLILSGSPEAVRDIRSLLSPADLVHLLQCPEDRVREGTITAMRLFRQEPEHRFVRGGA